MQRGAAARLRLASFRSFGLQADRTLNFPYDFGIIWEQKIVGGRGSGRSSSFGVTVDKTNEFQSIDLAWLRRQKLLNPGRWSTLTWSRRGQTTGSIRLEVFPAAVRLVYRHRPSGGDWQDVSEWVPLVETETAFGGRRQWFECLLSVTMPDSVRRGPVSLPALPSRAL